MQGGDGCRKSLDLRPEVVLTHIEMSRMTGLLRKGGEGASSCRRALEAGRAPRSTPGGCLGSASSWQFRHPDDEGVDQPPAAGVSAGGRSSPRPSGTRPWSPSGPSSAPRSCSTPSASGCNPCPPSDFERCNCRYRPGGRRASAPGATAEPPAPKVSQVRKRPHRSSSRPSTGSHQNGGPPDSRRTARPATITECTENLPSFLFSCLCSSGAQHSSWGDS